MKVLVVGGGAREHALIWKLKQSSHVSQVICAPGNPGIARISTCVDLPSCSIDKLADLAIVQGIDLTVASSESCIRQGIVDYFRKHRLRVFGPTESNTKIFQSRYLTKEFMLRNKIPTSRYAVFEHKDLALAYVNSLKCPLVIKTSDFALFHNIMVVESHKEAHWAIEELFSVKRDTRSDLTIIVEDHLIGQKLSLEVLSDGSNAVVMLPVHAQKRLWDDDRGPVTPGMGAYADLDIVNDSLLALAVTEIIDPLLKAFCNSGTPFVGALHLNLCFDENNIPRVVSLGPTLADIETQVLMPLLDEDLFEIFWAITENDLAHFVGNGFNFHPLSCLAIAFNRQTAQTFPQQDLPQLEDGHLLRVEKQVVDKAKPVSIDVRPFLFHDDPYAAAADHKSRYYLQDPIQTTHRAFTLAVLADNLLDCKIAAYELAKKIKCEGLHFRRDIGDRGLG